MPEPQEFTNVEKVDSWVKKYPTTLLLMILGGLNCVQFNQNKDLTQRLDNANQQTIKTQEKFIAQQARFINQWNKFSNYLENKSFVPQDDNDTDSL